jgi:hypothetical protein
MATTADQVAAQEAEAIGKWKARKTTSGSSTDLSQKT